MATWLRALMHRFRFDAHRLCSCELVPDLGDLDLEDSIAA